MKHPSVKFVILTGGTLLVYEIRDVKFPSKIGVFCVPENYSQAKRVSSRQWLVGSFAGAAASSAVCYCRKGRSRSNARRKFSCMLGKLFLQ